MMGRVSINRDSAGNSDSTSVSNIFIDEYMTAANDAQLKIYLYLLRMMRAGLPTSLGDLADRFNLTEKDVTRALKFWEKRGIVSMEYDESKHLSGIHIEDLNRVSAGTAGAAPAPVKEEPVDELPQPAALPDVHEEDELGTEILFIAEQYVGRPLSVSDTKRLFYIHDELGFSDALLDFLIQYCVDRGKKDFRYMEKVAVRWKESGYETPEQAKGGTFKYDKRVYEIMDRLGLNNVPTATEAAFVERWISEYRMPVDVIREACARTVLATQKRRLEYAEGILKRWHESGVTKKSDIDRLDEEYENARKSAAKKPAASSAAGARSARIHNFPQRDYDYESLEKKLIQN